MRNLIFSSILALSISSVALAKENDEANDGKTNARSSNVEGCWECTHQEALSRPATYPPKQAIQQEASAIFGGGSGSDTTTPAVVKEPKGG